MWETLCFNFLVDWWICGKLGFEGAEIKRLLWDRTGTIFPQCSLEKHIVQTHQVLEIGLVQNCHKQGRKPQDCSVLLFCTLEWHPRQSSPWQRKKKMPSALEH